MRIVVFGDSTSYWTYDYANGGWVNMLFLDMLKRVKTAKPADKVFVYNCSISGDTTENLLSRFETEVKARNSKIYPGLGIIFNIGINDSLYSDIMGKRQVSISKFRTNILELARIAKKYTNKVAFLSLLPVDSRASSLRVNPKIHASPQVVKEYNEVLKTACLKSKCLFLDIMSDWSKRDCKKLLEDGLHPSSKGHELIFKTVKDFLIKNKFIKK